MLQGEEWLVDWWLVDWFNGEGLVGLDRSAGTISMASLEERVAALEAQLAEFLKSGRIEPKRDAWRTVVGMFAKDPQIESLHRETQRIRDEDRKATRGCR